MQSGFRASGIHPLDRQQVLNRLSGQKKTGKGDVVLEVLNDSVMGILKAYNSSPSTSKPVRGKKITPGKQILPMDIKKPCKGKCTPSKTAEYIGDDDRWIKCDNKACKQWYHIRCSGIYVPTDEYLTYNLDDVDFQCPKHTKTN